MSALLEQDAAWEATFTALLYRQLFRTRKPLPAGTHVRGKTAIVTGANVGLGLEASRQLLALGLSKLIVAVRSREKGDNAAQSLRSEFPQASIEVWMLDMEDYDSITSFVKQCETLPRIDYVMLNAGLQNSTFKLTSRTHHAQTLQVNYISTALLTILLLPVLKSRRPSPTQPATLCISTSDMASAGKLDDGPLLAQFDRSANYSWTRWYAAEKLLQHLFLARLAKTISADDVLLNMVSPGATGGTAFFRPEEGTKKSSSSALLMAVMNFLIARSVADGASTYIHALVVEGKESHGSYIGDWAVRPYPPIMYTKRGDELAERLWEETMEELSFAHASKIVQDMQQRH